MTYIIELERTIDICRHVPSSFMRLLMTKRGGVRSWSTGGWKHLHLPLVF